MYKYLLGNNPKKSPGLPFIKMSLKNSKMNNISKRMNKSLIYLSKETELLVLGNNNLSEKQEKKNLNKTAENIQNTNEDLELFYFKNKNKNKKKEDTNKPKEKSKKKIRNTKLISSSDYLKQKLNRVIEKNKNKNKNKITNVSSMNSNSTLLNNLSMKSMKHYYPTNTNRKNENTSEKNTVRNLFSKNHEEENSSERTLFTRVLSSKKIKNSTYRNIARISSLLNDTSKKYIMLNMKLKNYSQENSIKNIKKSLYDKSLQQSKSMDIKKINFKTIFDEKDNIIDKPLKQIKDVRKNRMIWIKKSTANLLTFGKVSQLMKDEQFYKERKRIIGNYLKYEKEADLYIKKRESEKNSFRSEKGIKNMRKIDELLAQNHELLKSILNRGEDKKE